ncbi:FAD/NAD(P)-binding domain-containing protein [Tricholoma matsutake]|nr:FAD/NAD(P)-binding domain-containing protein [Tricholoma matsutake 945]
MTIPAKQAHLNIDFLIVGGGIAGLASAIALRRVGHRVTVLERNKSINDHTSGGIRMAPNLTKIMYHWGLRKELQAIAINSQAINLLLCETGEVLGTHVWQEEMLRETRGDFVYVHHGDFRKLLYNAAISNGAKVRLNTRVVHVDPDNRTATLAGGEVLRADVVVGADGVDGLSRQIFEDEEAKPTTMNLYSTTVPKKLIMENPDLQFFYNRPYISMFCFFGNSRLALGYPLGGTPEFGILVYGPADGRGGSWDDERAPRQAIEHVLESCEPRLRKLARLARPPVCVPVVKYPHLEEWVHDSGRMLVIGQAAHPLPPASIQESAMSVEDGAVLAKLFSHLRSEDQISSFLYAFQDLRQDRCEQAIAKEFDDINYMAMPPGDFQRYRDQTMRSKRDAGLSVLDAAGDLEINSQWEEIKQIFGYDAEDEADNWWNDWGLLRERSIGRDVSASGIFDAVVVEQQVCE